MEKVVERLKIEQQTRIKEYQQEIEREKQKGQEYKRIIEKQKIEIDELNTKEQFDTRINQQKKARMEDMV